MILLAERFLRSCARFRLDPGLSTAQISDVLTQCVRLSGLRSAYVEMIVTRGQPPWGSRDPRQAVNRFHAFAVPYVWIANEAQRAHGLHVQISDVQRIPPASVDPTAKNYHWNDLTMGLLGALDAGADTGGEPAFDGVRSDRAKIPGEVANEVVRLHGSMPPDHGGERLQPAVHRDFYVGL